MTMYIFLHKFVEIILFLRPLHSLLLAAVCRATSMLNPFLSLTKPLKQPEELAISSLHLPSPQLRVLHSRALVLLPPNTSSSTTLLSLSLLLSLPHEQWVMFIFYSLSNWIVIFNRNFILRSCHSQKILWSNSSHCCHSIT